MKKKFLYATLAAFAVFTACSESSSSNTPVAPAQENTSSDSQDIPQSSSESSTSTTASNSGCVDGAVATPVEFPLNDFIDVGTVYQSIQCNEKVVFMVRHAEREPGIGSESPLTEDGVLEAQAMGAKLIGAESFQFIHSGFVRTYQTSLNIAIGRGQAQLNPDSTVLNFPNDTVPELADGWFMKSKEMRDSAMAADSLTNVNMLYAMWAYEGAYPEVFYDLAERSEELIHTHLVKPFSEMPKYTVVASHDQVIMPLAVYVTNKQIDLRLHDINSRNWLNYLAGVAIIINDKDELRYVAIKGSEDGVR